MHLSFAPMEGITNADYRRVHRSLFPGVDRYYSPFIAPDSQGAFRLKHLRGLLPDALEGAELVPQLLTNSAPAFLKAAEQLRELGFAEVDLNLGCPSGTVVAKHKGAGMLLDREALARFFDEVFEKAPLRVSVKTRLGQESAEEFPALLELYSRYPISELIIHSRDRRGFYRSKADFTVYAWAKERTTLPLCYNGDLFRPEDLEKLPGAERLMLARGAVTNPALFREMKGGEPLKRGELRAFHEALLEAALASGLAPVYSLARMKELWYYQRWLFPASEREMKRVLKSRSLPDYRAAVASLFSDAPFDPRARFEGNGNGSTDDKNI